MRTMSLVIVSAGEKPVCAGQNGRAFVDPCSVAEVTAEIDRLNPRAVVIAAGDFPDALDLACKLNVRHSANVPIAIVTSVSEVGSGNVLLQLCAAYEKAAGNGYHPTRRVTVDQRAREVISTGLRAVCSPMELRFLIWFLRYPGVVFSRMELLRRLSSAVGDPRIVDVMVRRIREKVEWEADAPAHLITVRGIGYVFHHNSDLFIDGLTGDSFRSWPCCS
jgi:DNA-binding response OmpR family regulator